MTEEVIVTATRASANSATAFTNIDKSYLEKQNLGQDLAYLVNLSPSVVVSSDAGNGVGYTGIRIRGSDNTRVNLTINGIPLNDAESQRSEEHTSELQSLMRISYAVLCLKKKKK